MSSKKGSVVYQQIELTTAEWETNTTVYPASIWLFERLESGRFNMKLSDGVHSFADLPAVMQDVVVSVKTDTPTEYVLEIITPAGTFTTPNLKGRDGGSVEYIPGAVIDLTSNSTSDEIFVAWGGKDRLLAFIKGYTGDNGCAIKIQSSGANTYYTVTGLNVSYQDDDNASIGFAVVLGAKIYGFVTQVTNGVASLTFLEINVEHEPLDLDVFTGESGTVSSSVVKKVEEAYNNHVTSGIYGGYHTPISINKNEGGYFFILAPVSMANASGILMNDLTIILNPDSSYNRIDSGIQFDTSGNGTYYLNNAGQYTAIPVSTPEQNGLMAKEDKTKLEDSLRLKEYVDVESLELLPSLPYNLRFAYTSNSPQAINFADIESVPEMQEFYLSILNSSGTDFNQPIPNANNWQCKESSILLQNGKPTGISIKKEHGIMVVIV